MVRAVIIAAGGTGSRMNSSLPKQFLELNGYPVIMHSIARFHEYDSRIVIVIVLPPSESERWEELKKKYRFTIKHAVVAGGKNRFHSVWNGLRALEGTDLVAVHDAARPLAGTELIGRCFDSAEKMSCGIPAIPVADSIRKLENGSNLPVERESLRIIQTPQCFRTAALREAYKNASREDYTDDACVFEANGNRIHLVDGETTNLKITRPEDLELAAALEKKMFANRRQL